MNSILLVTVALVATVIARPDGPGGHHHGAHHGAHHGDHGAHHGADHGAAHHATHQAQPIATVNLGSSHHVGAGVHHAVHSVHNVQPVHTVHSVQPVHSSFSIQSDPVHHAVHQNVVAPVVVKNAPQTIAGLVSTNPKFSTLLTAVQAAGLADTLAGEGPFTVFAPTNTAFDKVRP